MSPPGSGSEGTKVFGISRKTYCSQRGWCRPITRLGCELVAVLHAATLDAAKKVLAAQFPEAVKCLEEG